MRYTQLLRKVNEAQKAPRPYDYGNFDESWDRVFRNARRILENPSSSIDDKTRVVDIMGNLIVDLSKHRPYGEVLKYLRIFQQSVQEYYTVN
ncbi:hypothetical protein CMO83_04920 [Candidatus Woesearchaeota archaeon]|jgi:hypothetical protein|nr:hypothetical protein [Candidatus Woesearchaeota archaeon]|tara:strand:- start:2168 stop:2443 length:276 start_codon:yes stop_codon:yes gene_type:complete